VQQGWPAPPQATQLLVLLLELLLQAVPGSRQAPPGAELEQQVCPVAPHVLHTYPPVLLSEKHCVPASVQTLPAQQGAPDLPHGAHTELVMPDVVVVHARSKLAQVVPVGRLPLMQQGSLTLPQVQRPVLHEP
jgi:hypothetical protein